jgi:peptidyl-prolyl cis-trans isomerase D
VAVPRGWIVWQVAEIKPAGVRPLEDVRAEVEQALRRERALSLAAERGAEIAERWRGGEAAEDLANELGTTVITAEDHRRGSAVGTLGTVPALDDAVFAASAGAVVGPVKAGARGVLIAEVNELTVVDQAELASQRETLRAQMMAERAGRLMRATMNELRRDTVITVDNELLQRFAPASS